MTKREGIALVVFVLVAVAFVFFWIGRLRYEAPASMPPNVASPSQPAPLPPTPVTRTVASDTRLLEQGQFYISSFQLLQPATVTVSVSLKSGAAIDSYFVAEQGLNTWEAMAANNQSIAFPYITELTMAPLDGDYTRSARLGPGKYALIVDNSRLGATAPPFHFFKHTSALIGYEVQVSN